MNDQSENGRSCQPTERFQRRFEAICSLLGLGEYLSVEELGCLCTAVYYGALCNVAFNGLGGCGGKIRPEGELQRIGLEQEFVAARARVFLSAGWKRLPRFTRELAVRILLSVYVMEDNLA